MILTRSKGECIHDGILQGGCRTDRQYADKLVLGPMQDLERSRLLAAAMGLDDIQQFSVG